MNKKISLSVLFLVLSSFVAAAPANQLEDIDNQIVTIENLIRNAENPITATSPITSVLTNPWLIGLVALVILHFVAMRKVRLYRNGFRGIRRVLGLRRNPFSIKHYNQIHNLVGQKVQLMKEIDKLFQKYVKSGFDRGNLATIYTEANKEYFSKPFSRMLHEVLEINDRLKKISLNKLVFDYDDLKRFFGDNKFKNAINWNDRYLTTMEDSDIEELWQLFINKKVKVTAHENDKLSEIVRSIEEDRTDLKEEIIKKLNNQDFEALMLTIALAKEVHQLVNKLVIVIRKEDDSLEGLYELLTEVIYNSKKATPERLREYFGIGAGGRLSGQTQGSTSILEFFRLFEEEEKPILKKIFADRLVLEKVNELFEIMLSTPEEDLAASSDDDETTSIFKHNERTSKKADEDNIIDANWRFVDEDNSSKLQLEDKQKKHPKSKPNSGMSTT